MNGVNEKVCDVAVVGAGPAGIAAASAAAEAGASVVLLDDNPAPGGQIWRGGVGMGDHPEATRWLERLNAGRTTILSGTRVYHAESGALWAESDEQEQRVRFGRLVLATGARELFLPFPGWTLPNVVGAGGLQALVKSGLPIENKRVMVAGTGPLLLAVAACLSEKGAQIACICEQAPLARLGRFAMTLAAFPGKLREGARLRLAARKAPYRTGCWPVAALGKERVEAVRVSQGSHEREIACDYLACGFHLVPNLELPRLLNCRVAAGYVEVDEWQQTSAPGVYCAGEPTGIGGVELSLVEGQIAGYTAARREEAAKRLFAQRARYRKLVPAMQEAFRLRPELATLAKPDTIFCRCEDVPFERMQEHHSWKAAKLHTRCGMGPCQGRVCGAAAEHLLRWAVSTARPPVFPVSCAGLASLGRAGDSPESSGPPSGG